MERLDRYLLAVRKHLPWQRQDDIIAELRANLEAQLEEKEAALGRPLSPAEMQEWLKALGSPLRMAAHYQPQQYLIGPSLYPIFRNVLRIALSWSAVIYCIASAAGWLAKSPHAIDVLRALLQAPLVLFTVAAWVTFAFAAIEIAVTHQFLKLPDFCAPSAGWSPAELPPFSQEAAGGKKPKSFAAAVAEVIFGFFWLVWLLLVPAHPFLMFGPGVYYLRSLPYALAPIWVTAYWCLVALNILQLLWNAYKLTRGTWQIRHPFAFIVFKTIGLTPVVLFLTETHHAPIVLKDWVQDPAAYAARLQEINQMANLSLEIVCAIIVITLGVDIVRLSLDAYRKRVAAAQ